MSEDHRAISPYANFVRAHSNEYNGDFTDFAKTCADRWRCLTFDEKSKYALDLSPFGEHKSWYMNFFRKQWLALRLQNPDWSSKEVRSEIMRIYHKEKSLLKAKFGNSSSNGCTNPNLNGKRPASSDIPNVSKEGSPSKRPKVKASPKRSVPHKMSAAPKTKKPKTTAKQPTMSKKSKSDSNKKMNAGKTNLKRSHSATKSTPKAEKLDSCKPKIKTSSAFKSKAKSPKVSSIKKTISKPKVKPMIKVNKTIKLVLPKIKSAKSDMKVCLPESRAESKGKSPKPVMSKNAAKSKPSKPSKPATMKRVLRKPKLELEIKKQKPMAIKKKSVGSKFDTKSKLGKKDSLCPPKSKSGSILKPKAKEKSVKHYLPLFPPSKTKEKSAKPIKDKSIKPYFSSSPLSGTKGKTTKMGSKEKPKSNKLGLSCPPKSGSILKSKTIGKTVKPQTKEKSAKPIKDKSVKPYLSPFPLSGTKAKGKSTKMISKIKGNLKSEQCHPKLINKSTEKLKPKNKVSPQKKKTLKTKDKIISLKKKPFKKIIPKKNNKISKPKFNTTKKAPTKDPKAKVKSQKGTKENAESKPPKVPPMSMLCNLFCKPPICTPTEPPPKPGFICDLFCKPPLCIPADESSYTDKKSKSPNAAEKKLKRKVKTDDSEVSRPPKAKPSSTSKPKSKPECNPKVMSKSQSIPMAKLKTKPKPKPKPKAKSKPECNPKVMSKSQSIPIAKLKTKPKPKAKSKPKSKPKPKVQPPNSTDDKDILNKPNLPKVC